MTKTTIKITGYTDSDDKSRTVFETEHHGKVSAFNDEGSDLIKDLKSHPECLISVNLVESKTLTKAGKPYTNIRDFYGKVVEQDGITAIKEIVQQGKQSKMYAPKETNFAGAPIAEDVETIEPQINESIAKANFSKYEEMQEKKSIKNSTYNPTTMYVSYAKDIYCALLNCAANTDSIDNVMEHAIMMVKQAHKGFS